MGSITSTFTADVGIVVRFTMAHGCLLLGDISHEPCSGSELAIFGITVLLSSGDIRMIERTITGESTVPNSVVKNAK
jgi:hypothetical protein